MARQRISLVPDDKKKEIIIRKQIEEGLFTEEDYQQLSPEDQTLVRQILFQIASEKVDPNIGASALEFLVFAFIRLTNKKLNHLGLTAEDKMIEAAVNRILEMHDITNTEKSMKDWLFDYMGYMETQAQAILKNREEHIQRKKAIIGNNG